MVGVDAYAGGLTSSLALAGVGRGARGVGSRVTSKVGEARAFPRVVVSHHSRAVAHVQRRWTRLSGDVAGGGTCISWPAGVNVLTKDLAEEAPDAGVGLLGGRALRDGHVRHPAGEEKRSSRTPGPTQQRSCMRNAKMREMKPGCGRRRRSPGRQTPAG